MVKIYTDKELIAQVKKLKTFSKIPSNRWILGVRSKADLPNLFDDKFYIFEGEKFIDVITGTTNAGLTVLKNFYKYNKKGAAVLASDRWYYDVWIYGMHKGKIPALLQLGSMVSVFRDNDRDDKAEEIGKAETGFFGINFHLNDYNIQSKLSKKMIDSWSAGCQVPNETLKYMKQMHYFEKCGHKVSYCLIKEF